MKLITKTIKNKLKIILPKIIHENQSTFVSSKVITNNILIAFKVFHHIKEKNQKNKKSKAFKLEMIKAYDRVEWPFIEGT